MKIRCMSLACMFVLLTCLFCSQAFAQAEEYVDATYVNVQNEGEQVEETQNPQVSEEQDESVEENVHNIPTSGIDITAALAAPITMSFGIGIGDGVGSFGPGFGVEIQAVYRFGKVGLGVEQKINGVFAMPTGNVDENTGDNTGENQQKVKSDKINSIFLGGTFVILKEYVKAGQNGLVTFGEGIGVAYGANKPDKRIVGGISDSAFALKFDFGYTYFIQSKYGIGFNLEYMCSFNVSFLGGFLQSFIPKLTYQMIF